MWKLTALMNMSNSLKSMTPSEINKYTCNIVLSQMPKTVDVRLRYKLQITFFSVSRWW